jgi:hypothetical protein
VGLRETTRRWMRTRTQQPNRSCGGGVRCWRRWRRWAAAMAVAVATRGCFGKIIRHPLWIPM